MVRRMELMKSLFIITITNLFVNNILMSKFLGCYSFFENSKKIETAFGMGFIITVIMTLSCSITWIVQKFILNKFGIEYMQIMTFILIITAAVLFLKRIIRKFFYTLYQMLEYYFPLIVTNCAVLGVVILNVNNQYSFIQSIVNGFTSGLGITLSLVLFAGICERVELADVPKSFQGFPIALISAGLMAISFLGFAGLFN